MELCPFLVFSPQSHPPEGPRVTPHVCLVLGSVLPPARVIHHHHAAGREQECAFLQNLPLPSAILLLLLKTEAGGRENKAVEYRQGRSGDTC